jgi:hypothetical protein
MNREQELIDILYQAVLTVLDPAFHKDFMKLSQEQKAAWVTRQLKGCGFDTRPVGGCWGVLVKE